MQKMNNRKKAAASAGLVAVAATALLGGTLAQFTDRDTTETQTLQAGTVDVALTEGANWDTSSLLLAVDDTVSRNVTVSNDGNLAIKAVELSADVVDTAGEFGGNLSEAVLVTVSQDGTPLGAPVLLSDMANYDLVLPGGLAPSATTVLTFDYKVVATAAPGTPGNDGPDGIPGTGDDVAAVPGAYTDGDYTTGAREDVVTNPDNAFQGSALDVAYTVDAVQRDGMVQ